MFRKVMSASVLGFLLAGSLVTVSANAAAISNGVACKTVNAKIKSGGYIYKCTKNPVVTNAKKLTWVSLDCLNTHKIYITQRTAYRALIQNLPATLAALDAKIAAEQVKVAEASTKADGLVAQNVIWNAKLVEFTAARDKLAADGTTSVKKTEALASYAAAIRSINSAIRSNTAAVASLRKVGTSVATMVTTRASTLSSIAQAKDGVAQSLSMRGLVCQKGL